MKRKKNDSANSSSPLRGKVAAKAPKRSAKPIAQKTRQNAKRLPNQLAEAEKKLWDFLRNKQMRVKFRRQQPVGSYIVDFICSDASLVVELDGGQHGSRKPDDTKRNAFLQKEGFTVLRFRNEDVLSNLDAVIGVIAKYIKRPLPTSPIKGKESIAGGL